MILREYEEKDLTEMIEIWNTVVEEGNAFPQEEGLTEGSAPEFFAAQSFTCVARDQGQIVGLYILHPNNTGRCGHLCNASYAVKKGLRGKRIGEQLVRHCLEKGKELGFRVLQFNAVVASNTPAIRLYTQLGFTCLGTVPGGFRTKDDQYEDILLFYYIL